MYSHTQRAPLRLVLYALSSIFLILAWLFGVEPLLPWMFSLAGIVTLVLAGSFHRLTVEHAGDSLSSRFGPVLLFRRTVRYEHISSVEVSRTTLLNAWGIHVSLQREWVWNLWGRNCVVIRMETTTLRGGSDDAKQLANFRKRQMTVHSPTA